MSSPSLFFWNLLGYFGIFFTSAGSVFYSGFILLDVLDGDGYNVLYYVFVEFYPGSLMILVYMIIHITAHIMISKRMHKKDMLNRTQHIILFVAGASVITAYYCLYYFYPTCISF